MRTFFDIIKILALEKLFKKKAKKKSIRRFELEIKFQGYWTNFFRVQFESVNWTCFNCIFGTDPKVWKVKKNHSSTFESEKYEKLKFCCVSRCASKWKLQFDFDPQFLLIWHQRATTDSRISFYLLQLNENVENLILAMKINRTSNRFVFRLLQREFKLFRWLKLCNYLNKHN